MLALKEKVFLRQTLLGAEVLAELPVHFIEVDTSSKLVKN